MCQSLSRNQAMDRRVRGRMQRRHAWRTWRPIWGVAMLRGAPHECACMRSALAWSWSCSRWRRACVRGVCCTMPTWPRHPQRQRRCRRHMRTGPHRKWSGGGSRRTTCRRRSRLPHASRKSPTPSPRQRASVCVAPRRTGGKRTSPRAHRDPRRRRAVRAMTRATMTARRRGRAASTEGPRLRLTRTRMMMRPTSRRKWVTRQRTRT
mmetsp:Transcript_21408/g.36506  ORF Transcript_21408/g.36506 Transcript_21408/m.36506 type:complete len:207 (+) Transcript_21408:760-1380(+)